MDIAPVVVHILVQGRDTAAHLPGRFLQAVVVVGSPPGMVDRAFVMVGNSVEVVVAEVF